MQIKEAIEFLSRYLDNEHYTNKCNKAHKIAISALEKQTPMKPIITHHKYIVASSKKEGEYTLTHCPYCFYEDKELGCFESLVDKHTKYCRRCGQRLDWSEP